MARTWENTLRRNTRHTHTKWAVAGVCDSSQSDWSRPRCVAPSEDLIILGRCRYIQMIPVAPHGGAGEGRGINTHTHTLVQRTGCVRQTSSGTLRFHYSRRHFLAAVDVCLQRDLSASRMFVLLMLQSSPRPDHADGGQRCGWPTAADVQVGWR